MKRIVFVLSIALTVIAVGCNNDQKKDKATLSPVEQADSLEKEVLKGHDVAMPKSMKLPDLQKQTKRLIDSISKLPAKTQEAAAPYKAKLESLYNELGEAYDSMEKWMGEFDFDSARGNVEKRLKYLADEKVRIEKVKEAVLGSIKKADTLLKEKF